MVIGITTLVFVSALVVFALLKLDDTNFQIVVLPGIVLLVWLMPDISRTAGAVGIVAGALAYLGIFLRARGQKVPMPDYARSRDSSEHLSAPLPRGSLETHASEPASTPLVPDGPYYIPNTPEKIGIAASGTSGEAMRFLGKVFETDGTPIEGAIVEIWHADGGGDYDNSDFNCRGHQFTNHDGEFGFETVRPFGYGKRTMSLAGVVDYRAAHIHAKIRMEGKTFTTQVWFPGDSRNDQDIAFWKFKDTNVVRLGRDAAGLRSEFDFVI